MITRFYFLLLFAFAQAGHAETSWDKMLRLYSTATSYTMDLKVNFIMSGEKDPIVYTGCVRQSGANYYSSIQGITTMYGPNYWVIAYESNKTLYYGRSNPQVQKSMVKTQQQFADSLLKLSVKPRLKAVQGSDEIYEYVMKEGIYSSVEYTVQIATGYLTRVVYMYRASDEVSYEKVTIDYSSVMINTKVADSWFSEKTYFAEKRGVASGIGKFAGYQVINQDAQIPRQ
jgi:hypothetical protein